MSGKTMSRREWARLREERWTAKLAERVLAAQEASGEIVASFARRQGLSSQRLSWWRSRLAEWREGAGKESPGLMPAVVSVERRGSEGGKPEVTLRLGELVVEVIDAAAVAPGWLAALLRELGAGK